jgi:hypothetical protein
MSPEQSTANRKRLRRAHAPRPVRSEAIAGEQYAGIPLYSTTVQTLSDAPCE